MNTNRTLAAAPISICLLAISSISIGIASNAEAATTARSSMRAHAPRRSTAEHKDEVQRFDDKAQQFEVDENFNRKILLKLDKIVRENLYSTDLAKNVWPKALEAHRKEILQSKNLKELSEAMNKPVRALKQSHCQFATTNDETFYFLHSLFAQWNPKLGVPEMDYTGFVTGGPRYASNQVRYILDGSPAVKAKLERGDFILTVDGEPYLGQRNFFNKAKHNVKLKIERNGQKLEKVITPEKKHQVDGYIEGTTKSVRTFKQDGLTMGYLRVWCGGRDSHSALEDALGADTLQKTDGLILDLRDGYGGNSFDDIDFFFRRADAFPTFETTVRSGKKDISRHFYDKPLVVLINEGSRSGKELVAYGLKKSKRATLVGATTAGAVLAGRLFPLSNRCSLYLAVADGLIDGTRLEGNGVTPDIAVKNELAGDDNQLKKAIEVLADDIKTPKQAGSPTEESPDNANLPASSSTKKL